jgi:hypothetical protein
MTDSNKPERRSAWPRWAFIAYAVLFAIGVPWYWPGDSTGGWILGWPTWAAVSLLAAVGIAALTVYLCLFRWPTVEEPDDAY